MIILNENNEALILNSESVTITKEVNNFADIAKFFTSRSVSISCKNIPENRRLLGFVGLLLSNTRYPYISEENWRVYSGGIEIFDSAKVTVLGYDDNEINIAVSSGLNSFLKLLSEKSLGDFASDLTHVNTVQNIREGASGNKPYHYIFGYNYGRMLDMINDTVNYDLSAVTPSVRIEHLLNNIFNSVGWSYEFDGDNEYKEDYLLYPSGEEEEEDVDILTLHDKLVPSSYSDYSGDYEDDFYIQTTNIFNSNPSDFDRVGTGLFICKTAGNFNFSLSGVFSRTYNTDYAELVIEVAGQRYVEYIVQGAPSNISIEFNKQVNVGDLVELYINIRGLDKPDAIVNVSSGDFQINLLGASVINFSKALMDISAQEFFKEVLMRYAVVPYVDEFNKKITFVSQEKRMNENPVNLDMKHVRKFSVNYQANLAQNNYLQHKYSEDNLNYADGNITVDNENLKLSDTIYESFTFAPEGVFEMMFGGRRGVVFVDGLRQFENNAKEGDSGAEVEYKALEGRYYIFKAGFGNNLQAYIDGNLISNIRYQKAVTFRQIEDKYDSLKSVLNSYHEFSLQVDKRAYWILKDAKTVHIDTVGVLVITKIQLSSNIIQLTGLWRK